ncbi:MAG TPA: hypothetical protein VNK96_09580 [Fimbriimonadales bacterium]|nr:hypothetical protein [Fimbriimonadales bacterium]
MMKCEEIQRIIAESSVEELREGFTEAIEMHIIGCEACSSYRKELLQISEDLGKIVLPPPVSLDEKVLGGIHTRIYHHPKVFRFGRVALVAAVLALVMIVMGFIWIYSRYSQPEVIDTEPCKQPPIAKPRDVNPKTKGGAKEAVIPQI